MPPTDKDKDPQIPILSLEELCVIEFMDLKTPRQKLFVERFAVGSEGVAYEGRGWNVLGAHALHFNAISIGICLIGDWSNSLPPAEQIKTAKTLIATGVELGYIKPDYKLVGHRQVRDTECPGEALYRNLKSWEHYVPFPATYKDLIHVQELPQNIKEMLRKENSTSC